MHFNVAAKFWSEKAQGIGENVIRHVLAMARCDQVASVSRRRRLAEFVSLSLKAADLRFELLVGRWSALASQAVNASDVASKDESNYSSEAGTEPTDELQQSDAELARSGDHDAFARLIAQQQQRIAKTMWRFTRDRNDWEGLVQDVFVEAYCSLASLSDAARFGSWLQTIAVRVGYQYWKQKAQSRKHDQELVHWSHVASLTNSLDNSCEAAEVVHQLLEQLSPRDRLVITLMYLEELSVAEIAERAGWSQTMVKVQAHRARKKLRILLGSSQADCDVTEEVGKQETPS